MNFFFLDFGQICQNKKSHFFENGVSVRTLSVLIKPSCMNKNSSSELRFRRENIAFIKTTHDTRGLCIASKVASE